VGRVGSNDPELEHEESSPEEGGFYDGEGQEGGMRKKGKEKPREVK